MGYSATLRLNWLFSLLQFCVPRSMSASSDRRIHAENLAISCLLCIVVIPAYGLFYQLLGDTLSARYNFAAIVGVLGAMLVLRVAERVDLARDILISTLLLQFLTLVYRIGGPTSPITIWFAVCPLLATAAGGARVGLLWTGIVLTALCGVFVADVHGLVPLPVIANMRILGFVSTGSFVLVIALFLLIYERISSAAIKRLDHALDVTHALAIHDDLTGILNRRELMRVAAQEKDRADRYSAPLSLCLIDVDNFKTINDTWGHAAGDEVLKHLAVRIQSEARKSDFFGRFGGEEFLLLLVDTEGAHAMECIERIRLAIESIHLEEMGGKRITISAGVAENLAQEPLDQLLRRVDGALYQAKRTGRNRVVMATERGSSL